MENLKEQLTELLDDMRPEDLVYLHNEYCYKVNAFDDCIYSMDEFNEFMEGYTPEQLACRVFYGDFNPGTADYFRFNGYGNLVGMCEFEVANNIYISDIVGHIIENMDCLYNDDVQALLDDYDAEEE